MTKIQYSLSQRELASYVARQISGLFPDREVSSQEINRYLPRTMQRLEYCFAHINNKYYFDGNKVYFNHLHTDQYASFIYFLSNTIFDQDGNRDLASRVYAVNKWTVALEIFYEVEMPDIFFLQHPVGTVLGRCKYSDYLLVWQRASTGADMELNYPRLGEGVVIFGNASIIGDCDIGNNCWISYGATVMDINMPSGSVAFGQSPNNVIRPTSRSVVDHYFRRVRE